MIKYGLTSVTFRKIGYADIIKIAGESGLDGIEWGGDIHVPAGQTALADEVCLKTNENKLSVFSYGSYYKIGAQGDTPSSFMPVLETAVRLKAKTIRVWAGTKSGRRRESNRRHG